MTWFVPPYTPKHCGKPPINVIKGSLSEINTSNPIFYIKHHMDGSKEAVYHRNMIHLMDKVFLFDALRMLSIDQERFISVFFQQAHVTNLILDLNRSTGSTTDAYADMDDIMKQLDNFLGSYLGEPKHEFTRQA